MSADFTPSNDHEKRLKNEQENDPLAHEEGHGFEAILWNHPIGDGLASERLCVELARQMIALHTLAFLSTRVAILIVASAAIVHGAKPLSDADKAFVAKVSQGGMYEVELAKVAESKATTQDLKDQANTESHDHQLVGGKLKAIMEKNGLTFPTALNAEFQSRLAKMSALPADKFDAAYVEDMEKIHDADGAAFKQESTGGTNPDLKAFAAETYRIVQRHLGELGAKMN